LLRRDAEQTLIVLIRSLFERLNEAMKGRGVRDTLFIETPRKERKESSTNLLASPIISVGASTDSHQVVSVGEATDLITVGGAPGTSTPPEDEVKVLDEKIASPVQQQQHHDPFSLPSIGELLRVLVSLLDPSNRAHSDGMHRRVALELLCVGVEAGGWGLGRWIVEDSDIRGVVVNDLMRFLFQV
jgi:hypothetical protein